jgi:hypothetical protein
MLNIRWFGWAQRFVTDRKYNVGRNFIETLLLKQLFRNPLNGLDDNIQINVREME